MLKSELPRLGDVSGSVWRSEWGDWYAVVCVEPCGNSADLNALAGPERTTETAAKRDLAFLKRHVKNMIRAMREDAK